MIGFAELNEPGVVTGVKGFKKAVSDIGFLFNWSYVDADHIAYALSGDMPQRAKGTSPDFPILGTGQYDWKGFDPQTQTADWLPFSKHPQATDPRNAGLLEQQAGAGMGGGRRPVRLRPDPPPADDRRPRPGRHQGPEEDDDLPAGAGDGGTGDRGPARVPGAAARLQGDRKAEVGGGARSAGDAADLEQERRPPARPRSQRRRRGNAGDRADGRLVAEAGHRRVQAAAGQERLRTPRGDARNRRPHRWLAERAGLLRRLVGLRLQGSARASTARSRGAPFSRIYCGNGSRSSARRCSNGR